MKLIDSIAKKIISATVLFLSVLSIIMGYFVLQQRSSTVEASVNQELKLVTDKTASEIKEFFRERSRVVTTLASNDALNSWFSGYTDRGGNIQSDVSYQSIVSSFKAISEHDPSIKSVFYAPANTFEYFDLNGRYESADYFTNKRPWWFEALERDRLFITDPEIDANDQSIVTSIKTTVKDDNNKLIGVLGIDILGTLIKRELINEMQYQNMGVGFLITGNGKIIAMNDGNQVDMSTLPTLADLDRLLPGSAQFSELTDNALNNENYIGRVTYNGQPYVVYTEAIIDSTMELNWRIGFMVPETLITEPLKETFWFTILTIIAFLVVVAVSMSLLISYFVSKPLGEVVAAMDDIADGEGDLTQRLQYSKNDELGKLSQSFNSFIDGVQETIAVSLDSSQGVSKDSSELHNIASHLHSNINDQKSYIEQIAIAAQEMTQTIHGIANHAQSAQEQAHEAGERSNEGLSLADNATSLMNEIYQDVSKSEQVVMILNDNAASISSVLEVIRGIAEQTNLLALNAAIEAARAGEQGRGFAVVADEVRTLAQRTQESTVDIEKIISTLLDSATNAVDSMQVGRAKTEKGVEVIQSVDEKLTQIRQAIELIDSQSKEIADMVSEQAIASGEISQQTVSVNTLAEDTVKNTDEMTQRINSQHSTIEELTKTISRFKI